MIKLTLASLLAVLAIGGANAQKLNPFREVLPPVEFDHPYKGKLTVKVVRDDAVLPCKDSRNACAYPNGDSCVIYRRSDDYLLDAGWPPAIVMRHEIGHCNGWGPDHAGARRIPPLEIEKYF